MKAVTEIKIQKCLWWILIFAGSYLLVSCGKPIYVPVENVRTEYKEVHTRDSVYIQDSVHVKEKGDTVFIERYKTIYKDRHLTDSIIINDTIRVPYPVEKIVYENKLKWYQSGLIYIGILFVGLLTGKFIFKM